MQEEHSHPKQYENLTVTREAPSSAVITGDITLDAVAAERGRALKALAKNFTAPGFRKGHVPEATMVSELGEQRILEEVAERVLAHAYAHIIENEKLDAVGRPEVTITKLAPGNPIGFRIKTALYPEITLPDYTKLAAGALKKHDDPEKVTLTDAELEVEIARLREALAEKPETEGGKPVLPDLTDEFVQKLGDFKTVEQFTTTLREQALREKKRKAHEARRLSIVDSVLDKTKVEVPDLFIESELDKMVGEFSENVSRMGMNMEDYLKNTGKTLDGIKKEWRSDAEKRAKLQLVLTDIAKKEGLVPDQKRLEREVSHIMEHYSEAEETSVRAYVATMMQNELVFELLEGKEPTKTEPSESDEKKSEG